MEYFLENIARSLYAEYGNTLNQHCLVFPNRRAGLYFMKYLASGIQKPVWLPAIYTVNELFRSYSTFQTCSGEMLLFELYKVYRKLKKSAESFDDFYFWGDMILDDFDDIDKYLVNADLLFRNVSDIKNIDKQFGGLTESQAEIVRRFWVNFNPEKPTREKNEFVDIWTILKELYTNFRDSLAARNLAYEGMLFRDIAENKSLDFYAATEWEMVHFTGFNALNECEKRVMKNFQKAGKARFYWDYDNSYIRNDKLNSAGYFMRENLQVFGNDMPSDWNYNTMLSTTSSSVRRRVVEASSDVAQVKLIPGLMSQLPGLTIESAHHTAVVLADENLLMPVLTSLPESSGDINITMGYPLKHTLVYSLLRHLMDLQRNSSVTQSEARFGYREVISILRHTLMADFLAESDKSIIREITSSNLITISSDRFASSPFLKTVFDKPASSPQMSQYFKGILSMLGSGNGNKPEGKGDSEVALSIRNEFIYRIILSINRLDSIISSGEVTFSTETYMRILDKMLRIQSVPFSGEPLSGIQIMGILETRALDFRNLIILSVNEGILPSVSAGSSFIPFSLREAFGMPSVNHQESIYAYHFYRLLQRAENVTFLYNSNAEGLRSGEMSRFLLQMKYDPYLKPAFTSLSFEVRSHLSVGEKLRRSDNHIRLLNSRFLDQGGKRILSPSAINTWLNCRMKFYYRYVNGLREPETVSDEIDPAMLGEILHDVMKHLYAPWINKMLTSDLIERISEDRQLIETTIINIINSKFSDAAGREAEGNELIIREVLYAYVIKILTADKSFAPFRILHLETTFDFPVSVESGDEIKAVMTGGKIDRIDITNDTVRIVDYKTGSVADKIDSIEELFADDRSKDYDAWLQTLLYCEAFLTGSEEVRLRPSVYKVKKLSGDSGNDKLRISTGPRSDIEIDDYRSVREDFLKYLRGAVAAIFSTEAEFSMTSDIRGKCSYCPYRELCGR
jgi:CRISPR/Cas system-associated exonuclease Cas4 (RecB family)